ncbi:Zinc finger SWIM domain-containing protein 3 [Nymphon striatum]|nr:Zinc finger SWIM domain-containing protein 3 [Nymphon striatum]
MAELAKGDEFSTFVDLSAAIARWEVVNFVQLYKRSSRSIAAASKRLTKKSFSADLQFAEVDYACIHGGRRLITSSTGQRPNQSTFLKGCPFTIKVRVTPDGKNLFVKEIGGVDCHNHEISQPWNPFLTEYSMHFVARWFISPSFALFTGSTVDAFTDKEGTLLAIAFQTEEMRNTFAAFPELLLIDATYKLNDLRMPLYVLMNVDGNGESEVICLWLVATEDRNTISNLMDKFKERNSKWTDIDVIMSDKDMTERDVLTEKLPGAEILICLFHTLRSFRREVSTEKLGISSGERNMCLEMLVKIAHAKSEDVYQNLYEDFLRSAPRSVLDYYNHNWHDIRDQWVEGLKNNKPNFMNSTNNRLESTNQKLKSVISQYSGVTVFFQDLMKCINSLKNERDHRATNVVLKSPIHRVAVSETEQAYEDLLTPFAFKYVKQQLQFSLNTTIVGRVDDRSATVNTTSLGNIVVFVDSCECSFFTSMLLPCRHVFGVRRHLNFPLFDESLCALRWTVHYYKSSQRVYQERPAQPDDSNSADGSITLQVQGGERTRNVLSEQQKYRKAHFLMMTIAQIISEQGMRDFEYNMQVLNNLKDYLQERKKVVITEIVEQAGTVLCKNRADEEHEATTAPTQVSTSVTATGMPLAFLDLIRGIFLDLTVATPGVNQSASPPAQLPEPLSSTSRTPIIPKMPPKQMKRGRPKGSRATTAIGLPCKKRKKSSIAFRMMSETEKCAIMMSWLVDEKIVETCLRSDVLVQVDQVKEPERIPMKCLDENVAINSIRKYFSFNAWKMALEAIDTLREKGRWICKCCSCDLDEHESIGCDGCLEWIHMKCIAMKARPKLKSWFCRDCYKK